EQGFRSPLCSTVPDLVFCDGTRGRDKVFPVDGGGMWGRVGRGGVRQPSNSAVYRGVGGGNRVFLGTHAPKLDEKGRLFLPAKYRDELGSGVVTTKGQERCLYVFPHGEFSRITEALRTAPVTAKAVRDYSRVFFASASDEVPDKQGRITVPPALRGYAGLQRD